MALILQEYTAIPIDIFPYSESIKDIISQSCPDIGICTLVNVLFSSYYLNIVNNIVAEQDKPSILSISNSLSNASEVSNFKYQCIIILIFFIF